MKLASYLLYFVTMVVSTVVYTLTKPLSSSEVAQGVQALTHTEHLYHLASIVSLVVLSCITLWIVLIKPITTDFNQD
jgi:uncharacterized membrane protein